MIYPIILESWQNSNLKKNIFYLSSKTTNFIKIINKLSYRNFTVSNRYIESDDFTSLVTIHAFMW